jgi:ATP-dependent Lon protease
MNFFEPVKEQNIPEVLPIIPTIDVVVFPHMIVPLLVIDNKIIEGTKNAVEKGNKFIFIVACKKGSNGKAIGAENLFEIGTIASIIRTVQLEDGSVKVLVQGVSRARINSLNVKNTLEASVSQIEFDNNEPQEELNNKIIVLKSIAEELSKDGGFNTDFSSLLSKMSSPEKIADFILSHLTLSVEEAQRLLESKTYSEFFEISCEYLNREAEIYKLQNRVKSRARESMSNTQKEFYVREQIRALKEEIGDDVKDLDQYRKRLSNIEQYLSKESLREISNCIDRAESTPGESAEANVIKTYLECVFDLPWNSSTDDNMDIKNVRELLDKDHYGLKFVKERILDFLSVRTLSSSSNSPILCFYGPPGTGKTSLAQSIANAINRKHFRISVGGMRDEAEIRGHRRTYVGAIPGRFIKGVRQVQSKNPLIIIDEIDKIGSEVRGDPAAALLEILDYKQNNSFYDYYLGIPFDFSQAFFITTANNIESIPTALQDRLECIEIPAYTFEEKVQIAVSHLVPNALIEAGLAEKGISISEKAIEAIVGNYTAESGVRDLDRWIKKICSKAARQFVESGEAAQIDAGETLENYLGAPKFIKEDHKKIDSIGIASGLFWSSHGGGVLKIEVALLPGKGNLILTGQLGNVMKESAQAALSYVKAHAEKHGIKPKLFTNKDIHIHAPAGAVPKDGPSAGITLTVAILSAFTGRKVSSQYAMTGEIDLTGNILPVGGIKEKVLAARRHDINNVFIPIQNKSDIIEISDLISNMNIMPIESAEEAIEKLLIKEEKINKKTNKVEDITELELEIGTEEQFVV